MRRAGAALALLIAVGVAVAARADAPPDLRRLFPFERDVTAPQGGLVRLALPPDVLAATRPDLSDVRLFDAAGREVPYLIDTGAPRGAERALVRRLEARVLEARRERLDREHAPPLYRETYVLAAPPNDAPAWELVFDVSQPQFLRHLVIEALDADGAPRPLVPDAAVFRLASPSSATLRVPLPLSAEAPWPARLAVTLEGEDGDYLGPRLAFETTRDLGAGATAEVPLEVIASASRDGHTVIELARPSGLVPDALRLETRTKVFTRDVDVWDERPGQAPAPLGSGTVARLLGATDDAGREVALRAARGDRLRVEIADGDSPPLVDPRVVAVVRQPMLVFALDDQSEGAARATLRYGGGRAFAPRYDLAALQPAAGTALDALGAAVVEQLDAVPAAALGAARDNPAYDGAPALRFAMRPGAPLDARGWTHQRRLAVPQSPDGLTRLRLAPVDLAPARADLADLRVVDAQGRQWPYLLQADAARGWQALDAAAPTRKRGTSTYALRLPVAPMRLDQLLLESETSFVDRPFRLRARNADGAEVRLAEGRLTLRAERPQPLAISFPPQRLSSLELEVDDGDEAPLAWQAVRARTLEPELFLVAPAGAYTLLLGDPDAAPPRYELERVREVVLAVRGGSATAGPLEANPSYTLGARLAGGERFSRLALWGVLIAAVIVLGVVTLRTVRS